MGIKSLELRVVVKNDRIAWRDHVLWQGLRVKLSQVEVHHLPTGGEQSGGHRLIPVTWRSTVHNMSIEHGLHSTRTIMNKYHIIIQS